VSEHPPECEPGQAASLADSVTRADADSSIPSGYRLHDFFLPGVCLRS